MLVRGLGKGGPTIPSFSVQKSVFRAAEYFVSWLKACTDTSRKACSNAEAFITKGSCFLRREGEARKKAKAGDLKDMLVCQGSDSSFMQ